METKSLIAGVALVLGFWGVLSAWTLTGLATMSIPGTPPVAHAEIAQPEEIVIEASAVAPEEVAEAECRAETDETGNEQCVAL